MEESASLSACLQDLNAGSLSACLQELNAVFHEFKARQVLCDQNTTAWQQRVETKLDAQLKLLTDRGRDKIPIAMCTSQQDEKAHLQHNWLRQSEEAFLVTPQLPGGMDQESQSEVQSQTYSEKTGNSRKTPYAEDEQPSISDSKRQTSGALKKMQSRKGTTKSGFFPGKSGPKKKAENTILQKRREEILDTQTRLYKFTTDKRYEGVVMLMILLNALCVGFQVQEISNRVSEGFWKSGEYNNSIPVVYNVFQLGFNLFFVIELVLRWFGEGLKEFLMSNDLAWNLFDIVTVVAGLVELVLDFADPDFLIVASISVIRVLRILRVVRLVKLIRVYPWFHELRMMVESCLNSLKSYTWCILVLLLMTYLFAIFITTGTCSHLAEHRSTAAGDPDLIQLQEFFGSVDKSMLSLFQTVAGGRDWYEFYQALEILGLNKTWIYLFYISFVIFAVYNVMAAVFVESAFQSSAHDRELLIREAIRDSNSYKDKMLAVFEEMDADGTGTLTEDEFLSHLNDERVIAYFDSMKLDISDATSLFKLLDVDHSGSVEISEFIDGCQRLKGESRALDMHLMRFEMQAMRFEVASFISKAGKEIDKSYTKPCDPDSHAPQDAEVRVAPALPTSIPGKQEYIMLNPHVLTGAELATVIPSPCHAARTPITELT